MHLSRVFDQLPISTIKNKLRIIPRAQQLHRRYKLLLCIAIFCLTASTLRSQDQISIQKAGRDSITIYNKAPYSILLEFEGKRAYIYRNEALRVRFNLSLANVRSSRFKVSYDEKCFEMDMELCNGIRKPCLGCLITPFLGQVAFVPSLISCELPEFLEKASAVMSSGNDDAWKRTALTVLCEECCLKKEELIKAACVTTANSYRANPPAPRTYKGSDLIALQDRFAIDIYPYYLSGFKQPGLKNLGFSEKSYYGFRTALSFNLYKQKKRISGTQITVPFDFQQSPVGFRKNANASLPDTGYSWKNYSLGIGYRFLVYGDLYKNFLKYMGVLIDVGVSKNTRSRFLVSQNTITSAIDDNIKSAPLSAYFNIGYQLALFRGIGLYGSYYSTIRLKKNQPALQVPKLQQFNLGLYINLYTNYSYQY